MLWSLASVVVLGTAGVGMALHSPGLLAGRLSTGARGVMAALSQAVLQGMLSEDATARGTELQALLARIDDLISGLPAHAQAELSQLLALLASAPGRRWLAGVDAPWAEASVAQVQVALQGMRVSSLSLRVQAYQALHDIINGAFFADASAWPLLGYPGPRALAVPPGKSA